MVGRHSHNGDPFNGLVDSGDTDAVSDCEANEAVLAPSAAPRVLNGPEGWRGWSRGVNGADFCRSASLDFLILAALPVGHTLVVRAENQFVSALPSSLLSSGGFTPVRPHGLRSASCLKGRLTTFTFYSCGVRNDNDSVINAGFAVHFFS